MCKWGPWKFGECSKTCGSGIRINTRTKAVVEKDGEFCVGESAETEICNIQECPGNLT